jgi:hypothetical protein
MLAIVTIERDDGPVNANDRTQILRLEMVRRMSDGWNLIERSEFRMTMAHLVQPPAWRMLVELINPVNWLTGGTVTWPTVTRVLNVSVDEDGVLHRVTSGEVPRRWRQRRDWEAQDGPEPRSPERQDH